MPRDLFPLPDLPESSVLPNQLARATRRRVERAVRSDSDFQFCLRGLNACNSGNDISYNASKSSSNLHHNISASQYQCLKHVRSCISSLGRPPEELLRDPAGALRELCGTVTGYDVSPKSSRPVSFRPKDLSIPNADNVPVSIAKLWDFGRSVSHGPGLVDCFSKTKILSKAAASSRLSDLGLEKCYSDPLLRVPRVYGKFLKS